MASYIGDYYHDLFGKISKFSLLEVYLVTNATLTTFRGQRRATEKQFDQSYLPSILINYVIDKGNKEPCRIMTSPRFAQLYLSSTEYLHVDLPFKSGDIRFNQFLEQAKANSLIEKVNVIGEFVDTDFLNFWLHG